MHYGPEMTHGWVLDINGRFANKKLYRCEAGPEWLALQLGHNGDWLWLSWDSRCCGIALIDRYELEILKDLKDKTHPIFGVVKSHIVGGSLVRAFQLNRDRVLVLEFSRPLGAGVDVSRFIVFEATGRQANLIILDDKEKVIETAKHVHPEINRYRSILPGLPYVSPPPFSGPDVENFSKEDMTNLKRYRGIGATLAGILSKEWENKCIDFEPYLQKLYFLPLRELICQNIDGYLTVFPIILDKALKCDETPLLFSRKILFQFFDREREVMLQQIHKILDSDRRRLSDKIRGLSNLISMVEKAEKWNHYGTLLLSYAHEVRKGSSSVKLRSWDECFGTVEIELDPKLSPIENAKRYFNLAKKYHRDQERLQREMETLQASLRELDEYRDFVSILTDISDIKKILDDFTFNGIGTEDSKRKKRYTPPHKRFDLKGGYIVYVGLNAKANRYVTFEVASSEDIWFHAKEVSGSHVILKLSGNGANDRLVEFAASLAAYYSKAKNTSYHIVDYTLRKYVKALPKSGPGHVTYTNFSSIRVSPNLWLELLKELS
ncbi:Rqc2 family fibronectin-binding protein [Acetomicrobium sp. UBA5826]|uniref:Rqc2 family fibronectin-binding protein n=1 Tax=Acetomicrobium sp. UBA5826 TaxID=1946039 RepID=UPI00257D34D0|nr:NFACT family protein [Acetomicrobium sp. UBA5826]